MIPAHAGPVARLVATSLLVTTAVGASFLALTGLVIPGAWVREGLVGVVLVAAVAGLTRGLLEARGRRRGTDTAGGSVVPTLAAAAVALWFVLSRYGSPTSDPDLLVGPSHVARVLARLGEGGEIIRSEVAPVPGTLPIALIATGGTLAVLLLADALAGGLHRPAAVGLPLLALWTPTLVLVGGVPRGVFLVTVAALLLLLTTQAPSGTQNGRGRQPVAVRRAERSRAVITTASAVVVALGAGLVATASASLPSYAGAWYQAFTTSGDAIQLSEDLDVLGSLTERSDEVVLTYAGPEDGIGPLRTYTASAFDGRHWQRGDERSGEPFAGDDLLWPEDVAGAGLGERQDVDVSVGSLREDQLPVPVDPRTVEVDGTWGYDPVRDEIVGDRSDADTTYVIGVRPRPLDPDELREAGPGVVEDAYLEVPQTDRSAQIEDLAAQVVGDAPTAYDQAVELQRWLRDPSTFTYSTDLPRGGTGDPVWDFLQHRTGYCVQFATTMTVMARTLGIPARLGVGFLPGEQVDASEDDRSVWRVTGQDSHAWPELYFEGAGWVRFEPTPAVQSGPPPRHTEPRTESTAAPVVPQEVPTQAPAVPAPTGAETSAPTAAPQPPATAQPGAPAWVWFAAAGLVVVVAALAWFWLAQGRRRDDRPIDPEEAWQRVVVALARDGVRLPPPTTPRQAPAAVLDAVAAGSPPGREPSASLREGLTTLAAAVESTRYDPQGDQRGDVDLRAVADQVVDELTELRRGAGSRGIDRGTRNSR